MRADQERFEAVLQELSREYPRTPSLLQHDSPFELLIGVILSAQTTDEQVNAVLPALFTRFPRPEDLARAEETEVEQIIRSVGFYRRKTVSIIGAAGHIVKEHRGVVPGTMDELLRVPGVGRKSAGVILLHVYDHPAIIVDTHFGRVVRRLGYSEHTDPTRIEQDVARILPSKLWNSASMRLNYHGRRYCFARNPACERCPVARLCPSAGVHARGPRP